MRITTEAEVCWVLDSLLYAAQEANLFRVHQRLRDGIDDLWEAKNGY
jgi:hypothetical protein